jgi:TRAP-type C4-dicarboxylate transport system substrate-binding protein
VKHHLDMPFYASINVFVINKGVLEGMSAEDRQVMEDHCTPEWAEKMSAGWADVEAAGRDKIAADPEHILYTPNADQVKMWQAAAAPLTDEWKKTISDMGKDPDPILNGLIDALKKYDSYYGE